MTDAELRDLFNSERDLKRELDKVRDRIAVASLAYSDAKGFKAVPRPEALRHMVEREA